jgi:hypothetical protein
VRSAETRRTGGLAARVYGTLISFTMFIYNFKITGVVVNRNDFKNYDETINL